MSQRNLSSISFCYSLVVLTMVVGDVSISVIIALGLEPPSSFLLVTCGDGFGMDSCDTRTRHFLVTGALEDFKVSNSATYWFFSHQLC